MIDSEVNIGIDFDNTLVCYDNVFYKIALKRKLIPAEIKADKNIIHSFIRDSISNDAWTKLQGEVYGDGIKTALPYEGVLEFLSLCRKKEINILIISHKTKYPVLGKRKDLHRATEKWLSVNKILSLIPQSNVSFHQSRQSKIKKIVMSRCTHFIDDLPEIFLDNAFPENVVKILFDPNDSYHLTNDIVKCKSWMEIKKYFRL